MPPQNLENEAAAAHQTVSDRAAGRISRRPLPPGKKAADPKAARIKRRGNSYKLNYFSR